MTKASAFSGAPVNLYEITYGLNPENVFRFTNHDEVLTYEDADYSPVSISHSRIKRQGRPKKAQELNLEISRKSPLAEQLRGVVPRRIIRVRVLEGEVSNGSLSMVTPIWHGRITGTEPDGSKVKVTCSSAGAGMKRPALTRTYSRQCNVALYSEECGADRTAATYSTTVAVLTSSNVLTLASGWNGTTEQSYFLGGILEWESTLGTEYRAITAIDEDTLLVDGALTDLAEGDDVDVILGCPRTLDACRALHDNVNNYGGCPYIPKENPTGRSMI